MMGQQTHTESLFYYFRFEDQIPEDHLLRLIDRHIDFSFVRSQLKEFSSPTGPTVDRSGSAATPVVPRHHKQQREEPPVRAQRKRCANKA